MDMVTEVPTPAISELVRALEQATLMAKQLANTTDPSQVLQFRSSLHSAQHHLSSFLSQTTHQPPHNPPPPPHTTTTENSITSAVGADENDAEPMEVGDDDEVETEQNSKTTVERVEEKMRDCFIQNKRVKRPLSPTAAAVAELRRISRDEFARDLEEFDPHGTKLRVPLDSDYGGWNPENVPMWKILLENPESNSVKQRLIIACMIFNYYQSNFKTMTFHC
ncbi:unnamed protein product [Ilex paraguariensis]|uniref:Uncharacterized protein n=1 Tax=Ilex paraguariensis TaxID=185542 RepID=A0ABC8RLC2_9AQUA